MKERTRRIGIGALVALAIFGVMVLTIGDVTGWRRDGAGMETEVEPLVDALFDQHVIAFEVLGILLTAAMIGALVIARPLGQPPDETHYAKPTPRQLAASQDQANPEMHALNTQPKEPSAEVRP
jgi:hypothetical protein